MQLLETGTDAWFLPNSILTGSDHDELAGTRVRCQQAGNCWQRSGSAPPPDSSSLASHLAAAAHSDSRRLTAATYKNLARTPGCPPRTDRQACPHQGKLVSILDRPPEKGSGLACRRPEEPR